jgi:hypothetical protein
MMKTTPGSWGYCAIRTQLPLPKEKIFQYSLFFFFFGANGLHPSISIKETAQILNASI